MHGLRRLALILSIALVGMFGQAIPAAGSAHGPTAGSYRTTSQFAGYSFFPRDPSQPQISINVSSSTNTSNPLNGPSTTTSETTVFVQVFGETFADGCWVLDHPSDFTISTDLSGASLHTMLTDATPTCGFPNSVSLPLTVDVTWTGTGPINSFRATGHSECGHFHIESVTSNTGNNASATATVSPMFSDSFTSTQGNLNASDNRTHVEGMSPPLCMIGGGKGVGIGPQPAGKYQLTTLGASQSFFDEASQTSLSIFASDFRNISNPKAGPSTDTRQTSVSVSINSPTVNGFGCFLLSDPSAFSVSSDLLNATLHATVTDASPACNGFPNNLSELPLTIDVTWTGIGPTSSARNNTHSECLGYRQDAAGNDRNNNTSAVATLSLFPGMTFVSSQDSHTSTGSMGAGDTTTHVEGAVPPACFGGP